MGRKIKSLRLKLEVSEDKLARTADIPYTTLTKVETGVLKKHSVLVMVKRAKTLGVWIEDLIK